MVLDAAIEELTRKTLNEIFAHVGDIPSDGRTELHGVMDSYFTKRQQLEMEADRKASFLSSPTNLKIEVGRPDGF
jgi:hypothetical protein